jgi:antitoxin MazE
MRAVVKKWGNRAAIRIPKVALRAVKLRVNDRVELREESGRIVIEPAGPGEYRLEELLDRITTKNLHEEIDLGEAVGKEVC